MKGLILTIVGLLLCMVSVGMLGGIAIPFIVYGQNTTIDYNPATPALNSATQLFIAVAGVIGTIGTILASTGILRFQRAAKYMQTFGTKSKDIAFDQYKLFQAINIGADGKVEMSLKDYQQLMDDAKRRALAAEAQIKYLDPKKYLPNDPDKDPEMPREADMPGATDKDISR
jgi:hypothetical protein